ncbi:hypothetical protein AgCh_031499 [Apium graveolens]
MELREGMTFNSKEDLIHVVHQFHIASHQEFTVTRSSDLNWHVACKLREDGCEWSLKARLRKTLGKFQIMKTSGPHTCMSTAITQDHHNLSSYDIVETIKEQIVADPRIKEKVLMATAKSMFGYLPGRKKIRNTKKLVMDEVHGSWEESIEDLPYLMEALQSFNVGTKVDWLFKESESGVHENLEEVTFKRLFWAFKPCIDGFEHCIPVIHIDGTHLYGPYPGVLLSAVAVDGFSHILPLAFAIVESENVSSWGWFMDRLRRFVAGRRHGICIISDRHVGIMAAMRQTGWCEPYNHHRFCIRHLSTNFVNAHRRPGLKDRLVDLAFQVQEKKFDYLWEQMLIVEPRAEEWFTDKPLMKWTLAHDGGERFGIMTTNHAKVGTMQFLKLEASRLVHCRATTISKMAGYLNGDVATAALSQLLNLPEAVDKLISPSRSRDSRAAFDSIPVDILETSDHYIFHMDVPGLSKSDIQVTVEDGNTLVIQSNGKRKREDGEQECKYLKLERKLPQKLARKFRLPENCNASGISAKCENGVLTVSIEKLPPPKSKSVSIAIS